MFEREKLNLLTIVDSIKKILEYSNEYYSADKFYNNQRDFDATMMNFIIIGEMVNRLSDDFIGETKQIDWFKIRGFRNIVAHDYFGIDAEEVWQIIRNNLPILLGEINEILDNM